MARFPDRRGGRTYDRTLRRPRRARARPLWLLVRAVPRSAATEPDRPGTFQDIEAPLPYVASMGFDVLYLPPIHPIGRSFRKGPNNTLDRRTRRPGQPLGHRLGRGRAQGDPSRTRHPRGLRPPRRRGPRTGHRDRARHRLPVLARPPLRPRAPAVVSAPARWLDQVRGEPAQEISGHLSDRLRVRRLEGPLGRAPRRLPVLGRPGVKIFRVITRTPSRSRSGTG